MVTEPSLPAGNSQQKLHEELVQVTRRAFGVSDSVTGLPDGVTEADLVEGPKVVHLPSGRGSFVQPEASSLVQKIPPFEDMQKLGDDMLKAAAGVPVTSAVTTAQIKKDYPAAIELALDVLSARLLGLISLVAACLIWGGIVWDPEFWRIIAGGVFSLTVFLPIMAIYWRAGMTGEGG